MKDLWEEEPNESTYETKDFIHFSNKVAINSNNCFKYGAIKSIIKDIKPIIKNAKLGTNLDSYSKVGICKMVLKKIDSEFD